MERYTFTDIFCKELDFSRDKKVKISKLIVPKIQRPYAQGREDRESTYVRKTILDEMFVALAEDKLFDFNFIYGNIRASSDEYVMELLDGQQRITTLFLVYWYIANQELKAEAEDDKVIRDALSRFFYETRSSSTVFCQKLASYRIEIGGKKPSEVIRQVNWYFKSFDRDSTITAMLTMLDAIHERYIKQNNRDLHTKLRNIQFYVHSLGVFNLSEELYIKMNARGLQLTPFENFKADLTHYIEKSYDSSFKALVPLYHKESGEEVEFRYNFSVKLDAKWIDIFWQSGAANFDASYMSFFTRFFACKYIIALKESVSNKDSVIKHLYTETEERIKNKKYNEYLGFQVFHDILEKHPEYILQLDKVLDTFYEYDFKGAKNAIYEMMTPAWEKSLQKGDNFYCSLASDMTQSKLVIFGAVIEYIDAFELFDTALFAQWMRVVWNVVENTDVDNISSMSLLIRKFSAVVHGIAKKMSEGESFYNALVQWKGDNTDARENRALREEMQKAKLIAEDEKWLPLFEEAEKHPYFKGMVLFFYEAGMSLSDYEHNLSLVKEMFDESGITKEYRAEHLLIRAIVSQFTQWEGELNQCYITERAEPDKFLKKILATNKAVRQMFADVLRGNNKEAVKNGLNACIQNANEKEFTPWKKYTEKEKEYCNMAIARLRNAPKLYDWVAFIEKKKDVVFRVYWYGGHIMFAVPNAWHDKVALDTERAKIAKDIVEECAFDFCDRNQRNMIYDNDDCFGKEIWLQRAFEHCTLYVVFCLWHTLYIKIQCKEKEFAEQLFQALESDYKYKDEAKLELELKHPKSHFKAEVTTPELKQEIERILASIAALTKNT
jgi:hypothetical protein